MSDETKRLQQEIADYAATVGIYDCQTAQRVQKTLAVSPDSLSKSPTRLTPVPMKTTQVSGRIEKGTRQVRRDEQNEINQWLHENVKTEGKTAIFFTLKFHRKSFDETGRTPIGDRGAEKILNKWLNSIDRSNATKREVRRGQRVERVVFKHTGFSGENIHYHGVLLVSKNSKKLLRDCKKRWAKMTDNSWVDVVRSKMEISNSINDTLYYSAHEIQNLGAENSWCLYQTHMPMRNITKQIAAESEQRMKNTWRLRQLRLSQNI